MPATPERIAFIREEFRRAVAVTGDAETRHGNLARESEDPIETFFSDVDDALLVATARQAILSPERRRFVVQTTGIDEAMALTYFGEVPLARYVDSERGIDKTMAVSEIVIDFENQRAALMIWG